MKKEQRKSYRDLIDLMPTGYGLCSFCKFASWEGGSCCEAELECEHPLDIINGEQDEEHPWNVWAGDDCWGYRPNKSLQEIGIIVSITMTGNNAHKSQRYGEYVAIIPSGRDKAEGLVGVIV